MLYLVVLSVLIVQTISNHFENLFSYVANVQCVQKLMILKATLAHFKLSGENLDYSIIYLYCVQDNYKFILFFVEVTDNEISCS